MQRSRRLARKTLETPSVVVGCIEWSKETANKLVKEIHVATTGLSELCFAVLETLSLLYYICG